MSTRATIRFATREEGVTFNKHPKKWHAQFYRHHDGYPEGLGLDIADCLLNGVKLTNWEVEHIDIVHSDIEYMYYIWQDHGKSIWISIFEMHQWSDEDAECIFVGTPEKLLTKYGSQLDESYYKLNTNNDG